MNTQLGRIGTKINSTSLQDSKSVSLLGAGEGIRTLDFNLGKVAEYSKALPFLKETIPFFVKKMNQY